MERKLLCCQFDCISGKVKERKRKAREERERAEWGSDQSMRTNDAWQLAGVTGKC